MNRTSEFLGCCQVFSQHATSGEPSPLLQPSLDATCGFTAAAKRVALGFEATEKLVDRLWKLVGRKGISNDPSAEIEDVSRLFKEDMGALQKEVEDLSMYAEGHGRGAPRQGGQRQRHCQCVVAALRKTAQEHALAFQAALHQRTVTLKEQNQRRRHFSHTRGVGPRVQLDSPLFAPPPVRPQGPLANFAPRQTPAPLNPSSSAPLEHAPPRAGEQQHPAAPTPGFPGGAGNTMGLRRRGGGHAGGEPTSAPAMVWQTQQMEVQHNASSRLVEARKVESMIGELGQMFSKFSTLVAEQQEVVMHIEDDVEAAHGHASEGQAHLARYYQIVQGNRGLIIKIFAILMCFIVLLTLIF